MLCLYYLLCASQQQWQEKVRVSNGKAIAQGQMVAVDWATSHPCPLKLKLSFYPEEAVAIHLGTIPTKNMWEENSTAQ